MEITKNLSSAKSSHLGTQRTCNTEDIVRSISTIKFHGIKSHDPTSFQNGKTCNYFRIFQQLLDYKQLNSVVHVGFKRPENNSSRISDNFINIIKK